MRRFFAGLTFFVMVLTVMTSCAGGNTREPTTTAAFGPPESALPYHAVFAIDASADERLISAAQNFCDRTVSFSNGGTVFSLTLSNDALLDLRAGRAELILLDGTQISAFSIISEAFRYKSYEHFSMAANSAATLLKLSDILGANVFAGYYKGSNVILSHGTLDSKFRPSRRDSENPQEPERIPVVALSSETARAFSLLGANVTEEKSLDARISAFDQTCFAVELSSSELDSPALLQAVLAKSLEELEPEPLVDEDNISDNSEDSEAVLELDEPIEPEPEPLVLTRAFTGIESVWLVFAPSAYEKLSQTGRVVVAEAAAHMTADIDHVYLEYERNKTDSLLVEDIIVSRDYTVTRTRALRLADDAASSLNIKERKLREAIAIVR